CLNRDVKARLRDIGEARIAIAKYLSNPATDASTRRSSPPLLAWTVAAILALVAGALASVHFRESPTPRPTLRMQLSIREGAADPDLALSPDGRLLAVSASSSGTRQLWLRPLDASQPQALPGTGGASYPFWSPDSRYIGFFADGKLKKVLATGGPPQ